MKKNRYVAPVVETISTDGEQLLTGSTEIGNLQFNDEGGSTTVDPTADDPVVGDPVQVLIRMAGGGSFLP